MAMVAGPQADEASELLRQLLDEDGHTLRIPSARNLRDLGGYAADSGPTYYGRFVRCGSTRALLSADLELMRQLHITRVLDLRSIGESPRLTCALAHQKGVTWENVPLYDVDISSPLLMPHRDVDNYLVSSYLAMISSPRAVQRIFSFFAEATPDECVLFHCAAGMDRTGVVSMLLLGLAGVSRRDIVADYLLSFGEPAEVEKALDALLSDEARRHDAVAIGLPLTSRPKETTFTSQLLRIRLEAIALVYDAVVERHGSMRAYLKACGVSDGELDTVRGHLLD